MIIIGNTKLMSLQEVLENVRQDMSKYGIHVEEVNVELLAVALDESPDFIRGALSQWE